ncbi:MAG: gfo/Idh/MocA family oxidoreductase [Candidatus Omnitrophota bacterium]|jgi:predicted dehydrogenase|nr:MAG: gfo/Idh/MocA family oxidoreductase [Candidatus Omnitrophota bacterium]
MQKADGMMYAPKGKKNFVCQKGEFRFACVGLKHGHIYGMTNGLTEAGGELVWVYDDDPSKMNVFCDAYPQVKAASCEEEVLNDESLQLIAGAAITSERGPQGLRVLDHGKHYLSDKAPFTTMEQLEKAQAKVAETGKIWSVCYSERVHNESAVFAGQLIKDGVIGKVLQVTNIAPHRLNAPSRPDWFFKREQYGGILCDLGSHQIEQFLYYANVKDAKVLHSKIANYNHPEYPELEDFGDATLLGTNGATNYFRVDWFTPNGMGAWGDGRTFIMGTKGSIELRKYIDVARDSVGDHVYLVDEEKEQHFNVNGKVGYPFFGELILDCLNGTENAMPQAHTFLAAQLSLEAQAQAIRIA